MTRARVVERARRAGSSLVLGLFVTLTISMGVWAQSVTVVPLTDASFERRASAWSVPARYAGTVDFATTPARTGQRSLTLRTGSSTLTPSVVQTVRHVDEGARYRWSAWMRGVSSRAGAMAELRIECFDVDGHSLGAQENRVPVQSDGEWALVTLEAELPCNTARINVGMGLRGAGTVWYDDVLLQRIGDPQPFVLLAQNTVVQEKKSFRIELPVRVYAHRESVTRGRELEAEVLLTDSADRLIQRFEIAAPHTRDTAFPLKSKRLPVGTYQISLRIPELSETLTTTRTLYVLPDRRPPEGLDSEGRFLDTEKRPFFPIGIYHVTTADYSVVAQQGFNTVQGITDRNLDRFKTSLDEAQRHGLRVDVPLYTGWQVKENMPVSIQKQALFDSHPAVLGWTMIDQPERWPEMEPEVFEAYRQFAERKDRRPIALAVHDPLTYGLWTHACDALRIVPHPLPDEPFARIGEWTRIARESGESWQHVGTVLQAGSTPSQADQPTYEQAQTMVYLTLLDGAESLFWYALRAPGWDLTKTPLWKLFPKLNKNTLEIATILRDGKETRDVEIQTQDVRYAARLFTKVEGRKKKHSIYLFLANPTQEVREVILTTHGKWDYDTFRPTSDIQPLGDRKTRFVMGSESSRTLVFVSESGR